MPTHRKNPRLASENYFGRHTYFITIVCNHRMRYLAPAREAHRVLTTLSQCTANSSFQLHAYCIMPDHLHILIEGTHDTSNLREFVRLFKQLTAFQFRKFQDRQLWEMSYYDHILRSSDTIESVAAYIWGNPVRKQLCTHPNDFPFSGSQTINWMNHPHNDPAWRAPWHPANPRRPPAVVVPL